MKKKTNNTEDIDFIEGGLEAGRIVQIERFIPVWVQCFLNHRRRLGLFTANGGHRKGIWESWRSVEVCQFEVRSDWSRGKPYEIHPACTTHPQR